MSDEPRFYEPLAPQDMQSMIWLFFGLIGGAVVTWLAMSLLKPQPVAAASIIPPKEESWSFQHYSSGRYPDQTLSDDAINSKVAQPTEVIERRTSRGLTFPMSLTLPGGGQLVSIDFIHGEHSNLPAGSSIIVPYEPVKTLVIRNDGAGEILFSIAQYSNSSSAATLLNSKESMEIKDSLVYSVNLQAPTSNASVRLVAVV